MGTDEVVTRRFLADPVTFVVRCPDRSICQIVEAAFVDLPDGDPVGDLRRIELREDSRSRFTVLVDDQPRFTDRSANQALGALITAVMRLALDADPTRLHLHCAAVSKDAKGVLITAPSGTGKTTLAAKLLTRGWTYGSDEAIAITADASSLTTFPKPLMIKRGASGLAPELTALRVALDPQDDEISAVPASALGSEIERSIDPRCLIVLTREPRRPQVGPSRPAPIHPADAVVAMMAETMDPRRFGPRAVEVLATVAAQCRCVEMQVGPLDLAASSVEALTTEVPPSLEVRVFDHSRALHLPWRVADHVSSVVIGDRAVLHHPALGPITALDEAGTAVWRTLLGDAPDGWGAELLHAPAMRQFLEQLMALGFVHTGERRSEPA